MLWWQSDSTCLKKSGLTINPENPYSNCNVWLQKLSGCKNPKWTFPKIVESRHLQEMTSYNMEWILSLAYAKIHQRAQQLLVFKVTRKLRWKKPGCTFTRSKPGYQLELAFLWAGGRTQEYYLSHTFKGSKARRFVQKKGKNPNNTQDIYKIRQRVWRP